MKAVNEKLQSRVLWKLCILMVSFAVLFAQTQLLAADNAADVYSEDELTATNYQSLESIVKANWPQWTDNARQVTYHQLSQALGDTTIRGSESAALAAMCQYMRLEYKKNRNVTITAEKALKIAKSDKVIVGKYKTMCKQLAIINRRLYSNNGAALLNSFNSDVSSVNVPSNVAEKLNAGSGPHFLALEQGPAGDCFMFSAIGWMALNRPDVITNAISTSFNGSSYTVTFPDAAIGSVTVSRPTDAEVLFNNSSSSMKDGLWITVLEKAAGAVWGKVTGDTFTPGDSEVNIDSGGSAVPVQKLWTGKNPRNYYLQGANKISLDKLRAEMKRMQKDKLLAQGGVGATTNDIPVPGHHWYAILGFDASSDTVTVWNPWGTDYPEKGKMLPVGAYARKHGIFNMQLTDFYQTYKQFVVE